LHRSFGNSHMRGSPPGVTLDGSNAATATVTTTTTARASFIPLFLTAVCFAEPAIVGLGGVLGLLSGRRDALEIGAILAPPRVAHCDCTAGSRCAMRILRHRLKPRPTSHPWYPARNLYDYDHGKLEQPQPLTDFQANREIIEQEQHTNELRRTFHDVPVS